VVALLARAAERRVPVNIAARLVDDRLHHWLLHVPPLELPEIGALVKQSPATTLVLSHFYAPEIASLAAAVRAHPSAYVDVGCCKPGLLWWPQVVKQIDVSRLLFGTGAPLYYHGGAWLALRRSELDEATRERIAGENAAALFGFKR
jgi:predicted TIM-barrel fold metal-dependent hydrolase